MFITLGRSGRAWLVALAGLVVVLGLARLTLSWERSPLSGLDPGAGRPASAPPPVDGAAITRGSEAAGSRVALTFDVLEGEAVVLQVMDVLAWRRVPATFFVTSLWARTHPQLVRQMVAAGHEVALRQAPRPEAGALPDRDRTAEDPRLQEEAAGLARITGRPVRYVRPALVGLVAPAARGAGTGRPVPGGPQGLRPLLWSLDLQDWMNPGVDYIAFRAGQAMPGEVLLLQASDFARQTPRALPRVLDALADAGLQPVPLSRLLGEAGAP